MSDSITPANEEPLSPMAPENILAKVWSAPEAPFPEFIAGLPVIHLALINLETESVLYHKKTTSPEHATWFKASYEAQAMNEEPGYGFYSGDMTPEEFIAAQKNGEIQPVETPV